MTPIELRCGPVAEALALLPAPMSGAQGEVMLLAIAMQESELRYRRQHGSGPARSLWQAERGAGCNEFAVFERSSKLSGHNFALFLVPDEKLPRSTPCAHVVRPEPAPCFLNSIALNTDDLTIIHDHLVGRLGL